MLWQPFLLAIGISLCLVGAECLVLDQVVLAEPGSQPALADYGQIDLAPMTPRRVLVPPEWAAWALLASGSIVILYSYSFGAGSGS